MHSRAAGRGLIAPDDHIGSPVSWRLLFRNDGGPVGDTSPVRTTRGVRAGLVLLGLLSVLDIVFTFIPVPEDEPGPPIEVLIIGGLLGLVSLVLVVLMWRGARGTVGWVLVVLRVASALLSVPAFFVPGVPVFFVVLSAVFLVLTIVGVVLVWPAVRQARV